MTTPDLRTPAWLLRGISSVPGELRLSSATVSFVAHGSGSAWPGQLRTLASLLGRHSFGAELDAGRSAELFAWPAREVAVEQPWYYFGGGLRLRHRGVDLRISFGRPAGGARSPRQAMAEFREFAAMRARGKLWAAALANAAL